MSVPIDLLTPILDELLTYGRRNKPARPWLGLYSTESGGRVVVADVAETGPAAQAGLRRATSSPRCATPRSRRWPISIARSGAAARRARKSRSRSCATGAASGCGSSRPTAGVPAQAADELSATVSYKSARRRRAGRGRLALRRPWRLTSLCIQAIRRTRASDRRPPRDARARSRHRGPRRLALQEATPRAVSASINVCARRHAGVGGLAGAEAGAHQHERRAACGASNSSKFRR